MSRHGSQSGKSLMNDNYMREVIEAILKKSELPKYKKGSAGWLVSFEPNDKGNFVVQHVDSKVDDQGKVDLDKLRLYGRALRTGLARHIGKTGAKQYVTLQRGFFGDTTLEVKVPKIQYFTRRLHEKIVDGS